MNDAEKTNRHFSVAEARRSVYELLSGFYLDLPDREMVRCVFDPDFEKKLCAVASAFETGEMQEGLGLIAGFISSFKGGLPEETLRRIAVDRTRLFRGISEKNSPPPPYESVYREERLWGESSINVYRFYCKVGLALPDTWTEAADFLGTELDFMRLLGQNEAEAWRDNQSDRAMELLRASLDFLRDHLLKWVDPFCERMYRMAELDFYKGLAKLTIGFLKYDSHFVEEQLKEMPSP